MRHLAELHGGKQGTPTMGGVLIIGSVVITSIAWARPDNPFVWLVLFCMAYLGVPFQLLRFQEIIHFYKSLYFSGHILGLGFYLILRIMKTYLLKQHRTEEHKNK